MKILKTLTIIATLSFFYTCSNSLDNIMTEDDIIALQAMETAYLAAIENNNSLAQYIETTGITGDETCFSFDHLYHYNDSIFGANHMMYSHNNKGDDHDGDSWMMGSGWMNDDGVMGSGGMMGNNGSMNGNRYNADFCTSNNINLMNSLMRSHEDIHPGN